MSDCSASEVVQTRREKGDRRVALFFVPGFSAFFLALALGGTAFFVGLGACRPAAKENAAAGGTAGPAPWRGSVVVFAFDVMRADHVGALGGLPGLTPELDRFAAEADYAGRAVAASSSPLVALASLFTGTGAQQHRLLGHLDADLRPGLPTLAEHYWKAGYDTVFFEPWPPFIWRYGLLRGMARTETYQEGQLLHELPLFDDYPRFYWVQMPEADLPYTDRRAELGRPFPAPSRARVDGHELMPHADPAQPLPADLKQAATELFRLEVAAGDARFGRMLAALRSSAAWENSVVVVIGIVGSELGEHGQVLYSQNLHRESIEVPLLIRLPKSLSERGFRFAEPAGRPVAAERLFATLAELLGVEAAPASSPSLFRRARQPAISALPLGNGVNLFSAVFPVSPERAAKDGVLAEQVIRQSRFAPAEPFYYAAQAAELGADVRLPETPRELFDRLHQAFEAAPAFESDEVSWLGETWRQGGGVAPLDEARKDELAPALGRWLLRYQDAERTVLQEKLLIRTVETVPEEAAKAAAEGETAESGGESR